MTLLDSALHAVSSWKPLSPSEESEQAEFLAALDQGADVLSRHPLPSHLTASAFILDAAQEHVLLVFHGKGRFWVQPGGHLESGDAGILEAALREATEETGLRAEQLSGLRVVDLDHHQLSDAFGHCRSHLDVGVAMITDGTPQPTVSDESEDVRWFPVGDLPEDAVQGFDSRLAEVLERLRQI
ncbi:NUDIX hydrolase [Arthrobacter sp. RCC_34]|uniref:NUDIX hydrolase n=1 Tax=Arthrobacter sp. RCC_34 TaxID=3239230 RepID=UPI0035237A45